MGDQDIGHRASSLSLGVTVILLYAIFVSMVTFGFGSYIYRTGWQIDAAQASAVAPSGTQTLDIDTMLFILSREQDVELNRDRILSELSDLQSKATMIDARVDQSFAVISEAMTETLVQLQQTMNAMIDYRDALPGDVRSQYDSIVSDDIGDISDIDTLTDNVQAAEFDRKVRALLNVIADGFVGADVGAAVKTRFDAFDTSTKDRLDQLARARQDANSASHDVQAEGRQVEGKIAELDSQRAELDDVISALREKLPSASIERARLSALTINLPFFPNILMQLVSFPTIFLTLIVTIAAGGLGTVVAFSRRYYSGMDEGLSLSRLFVNVGEGIAAAIAIFLFSGAGMLALTQGGGADNSVELSPYTVAFIAFLSGFMAEHAFASIQNAGRRIFKTDEAKDVVPATGTTLPAVIPEPSQDTSSVRSGPT